MFARCARVVPDIALAKLLFERAVTFTRLPSTVTSTSEFVLSVRLPFLPLIVTDLALYFGALVFAELDRLFTYSRHRYDSIAWLEDDAEHFAAMAARLGLDVRHDALRRGHDRDAETALHDGQVVCALEDAQAPDGSRARCAR